MIRVNSPISEALGIDRQREAQILKLLAPSGIIPKIFILPMKYWSANILRGNSLLIRALKNRNHGSCLGGLKGYSGCRYADGVPRNYLQYCRNYLDQLGDDCVSPEVKQEIETIASGRR